MKRIVPEHLHGVINGLSRVESSHRQIRHTVWEESLILSLDLSSISDLLSSSGKIGIIASGLGSSNTDSECTDSWVPNSSSY